jgi:transposase, IS5 family
MDKNVRFKKSTKDSFFGNFLYDRVIDQNHFLIKAKGIVNWNRFSQRCLKWYKGGGQYGAPPYNPSVLLRMLFISYLYDISERDAEIMINDSISMKYFLDLGLDQLAPDHSTLTYFKDRLIAAGGKRAYDELLREILNQAEEKGIEFGPIHILDATHTTADVNTDKDKKRRKRGEPTRDKDAAWGVKHIKEVKNIETGKIEKRKECFHGYKGHVSINAKTNLITAVVTTSGNESDNKQFTKVANKDKQVKGLFRNRIYAADRGYDDGNIHEYLKDERFGNAIKLKKTRTAKIWQELRKDEKHISGLKERYKIERKFAELKQSHGLSRCRYLGLVNYHAQFVITALAVNLKVVVASMTGSTLKGYAYAGERIWSSSG